MTLTSKRAGRLFQTVAIMLPMLMQIGAALAQDDVILYAFHGGTDGDSPHAGLIADKAGNLYGTTYFGGAVCKYPGCGTVFEISAAGAETVVHAFARQGDGAYPSAGLVADNAANLYGTTISGGAGDYKGCGKNGCGTVFKLAPDGTETVLYSFKGRFNGDGGAPYAGLIADGAGNLYGTTLFGGNNNCQSGCGTVFKVAPDGTETVLYAFQGGNDGAYPEAGLIADEAGNLYGTTSGNHFGNTIGPGTIFRISPDGTETVLHVFGSQPDDGVYPYAGLVEDSSGNFYGTTSEGGTNSFGTVFKLAPDGTETVLYAFRNKKDGENPLGGVILDKAGNLYGTTSFGSTNAGAAFKLSPAGKLVVLHDFSGGADGANPEAGLILCKGGELCGTTTAGGDAGTVFEIKK